MYLSTYEERENGSFYEEGYDGRNLSKLNLCEDGKGAISLLVLYKSLPLDLSHICPGAYGHPHTFTHTAYYQHLVLFSPPAG